MGRFQISFLFVVACICSVSLEFTCKQAERNALLKFKHSFIDRCNFLSSWVGQDCCSGWEGVGCHNVTGNVISLDLGTAYCLEAGEVNPALLELKYLTYLDLSFVDFNGSRFPDFFGSMRQLQHLNLFASFFSGKVPNVLGNLTQLVYLDLNFACPFCEMERNALDWASELVNLEYLGLGGINLSQALDSLNILYKLPSLLNLTLSGCQLGNSHKVVTNSTVSSPILHHLDLGGNLFSGLIPRFIHNLSTIRFLDLSHNHLSSAIPTWLVGKTYIEYLSLAFNNFNRVDGGIMSIISRLCRLKHLDLSNNQLQEEVSEFHVYNFSKCSSYLPIRGSLSSFQFLDLSHNNLIVVPTVIGSLSSLVILDLSYNDLENLPPSLGELSSLSYLDLSFNNLSVVHQESLSSLSMLRYLDLSSNSQILNFSHNWKPPFQLLFLSILPCKLNSPFPIWLLSQEILSELDLSDTGIYGPLPETIGTTMSSLQSLILVNNHINGSIPRSLCGLSSLNNLHLQNNSLSGIIPDCWSSSPIVDMELFSNILSGPIPSSLTKASNLQLVKLNNNSIEGELPLSWSNTPNLALLDVSWNKLRGEIPPWNGANFPHLQILILRENRLEGMIPSQLCSFQTLHIINLANNNLVGTIPRCFGHFKAMGSMLPSSAFAELLTAQVPTSAYANAQEVVKGQDREYTTLLDKLVNMDLSCNHFVGVIPTEITSLSLLDNLDLSHNHLSGIIPVDIGKMEALESLDLSSNNLSGSIPESMASLDYLSTLNLSFNNLQGKIPTGRHFQTLEDPSIYMNNPDLCGDPLPNKCFGDDNGAHPPTVMVLGDERDDKHEKMWFYLIIMSGFATGFWGVIGMLVAHKKWRIAYFRIAEELADWIYVEVAVRIAPANRGTRGV